MMMDQDYDEDDYELKQDFNSDMEYIRDNIVEILHTQEEILKIVEHIYEQQRKREAR